MGAQVIDLAPFSFYFDIDSEAEFDILECAEGNILRLWKVLVIISIIFAGAVFNKQSSPVLEKSEQTKISSNIGPREVLARESRSVPETETYYGKPGVLNLEEMLNAYEVATYPEDIVRAFPDPSFGVGSQITIYRATPVIMYDANSKTILRTFKKTIGDLLEEKDIELGDQDRIDLALTTPITKNLEITITRVEETQITEKIYLDFKTIKKEDPNLAWGKTHVTQRGEKGLKERVYKVKRENGVEISRVLLEERSVKEPKNQITVVGTKITYAKTGIASYMNGYSGLRAAFNGVPNGTKLLVVNLQTGKSVVVTRFSSGPFVPGRVIDLTYEAYLLIKGPRDTGLIPNVGVAIIE